jgi:hypothetical protein
MAKSTTMYICRSWLVGSVSSVECVECVCVGVCAAAVHCALLLLIAAACDRGAWACLRLFWLHSCPDLVGRKGTAPPPRVR